MCWKVDYVLLIIISTLVDYFVGLGIEKAVSQKIKKNLLGVSLLVNLGILVGFKYFNFLSASTNEFIKYINSSFENINISSELPVFDILLPVGISFYTFQTLAYTIDVYRGKMKAERDLFSFALYVSFFPQLVAGPIERAQTLLPQFRIKHNINYQRITSGLKLMFWGFFKKLVIADKLNEFVTPIYAAPSDYSGVALLLATVLFTYQIYCDFSGYSDIAIGSARIMGYNLMTNFKRPFFARSIAEHWRRWHISLSTWFKDYLYIPLGGSKVVKWRWYYNILITYGISGLWHGANWNYLFWGVLHGIYYVSADLAKPYINILNKVFRIQYYIRIVNVYNIIWTFTLVCITFIFFRSSNLSDAFLILKKIVFFDTSGVRETISVLPKVALVSILLMETVHIIQEVKGSFAEIFESMLPLIRWLAYVLAIFLLLFYGAFHSNAEFIYFQF